jgi:Ca-activated chloride channel homolog
MDVVSIYATVRDAQDQLVPDLTKDDFVVKDNGKKQTLTVFSNERQPISVVILLDASFSMAEQMEMVREGAVEFVNRMSDGDRGRIGRFGNDIQLEPETFTNDRSQLASLVNADVKGLGRSPIWTAMDRSITALLKASGRRVILLFTDGENNPNPGQLTSLKDIIWRARVNDVMVYTIAYYGEGNTSGWKLGNSSPFSGGGRSLEAERALKQLADQTGGGYLEMKALRDLGKAFTRIAEELHRQYWLGFKPAALDDEMHDVEVSVKRPKVSVQARKNYFAMKPKTFR